MQLHDDGASLLRRGKTAEAKVFLEAVAAAAEDFDDLPDEFRAVILARNRRKQAQVLQAEGEFTHAEAMLSELVRMEDFEDSANAPADLGLIRGGFRSLVSVLPRKTDAENQALTDSLSKVLGWDSIFCTSALVRVYSCLAASDARRRYSLPPFLMTAMNCLIAGESTLFFL